MSVQPAWNLDTTSTSTIQVAKGLLHAATTDNVQPLCIMACEQFGNTLAISPHTLRKIEHSVLPTPQPAVLAFLKVSIGYSKNDCVSYLGKSQAGVQFLALASALVTWPRIFDAATCLHTMLVATASDKTLVPTVRQVKDLLTSIEPRCHHSGFTDEVIGWHLLLSRHPGVEDYWIQDDPCIPDSEGLANMIDALRQLNRIGTVDVEKLSLRTRNCAAWTIAFIKWSLGYPPAILIEGTNMPLLESPESRVTVNIRQNGQDHHNLSVTIYSSIRGPSELVGTARRDSDTPAIGMIGLESYGQLLLDTYCSRSHVDKQAFKEALPYAISNVMRSTEDGPLKQWDTERGVRASRPHDPLPNAQPLPDCEPLTARSGKRQAVSPFRSEGAVGAIYRHIFKEELYISPAEDETDLREISSYDKGRDIWLELIDLEPERFLRRALEMTGQHSAREGTAGWIMASAKGQAVWLTIYESPGCYRGGYLSLSWHPGLLSHDGEIFDMAELDDDPIGMPISNLSLSSDCTSIRTPCNLFPTLEMVWNLSKGENVVTLYLGVRDGTKIHNLNYIKKSLVSTFRRTVLVERCDHASATELISSHPGSDITGPINPQSCREVRVVPVDGDDGLRDAVADKIFHSASDIIKQLVYPDIVHYQSPPMIQSGVG
ncbi:hypothetical protein FGRMN_7574 [Fusarium graminum]|nr:hypothetical protein FGRMN_7574 [Fusarium graminum]